MVTEGRREGFSRVLVRMHGWHFNSLTCLVGLGLYGEVSIKASGFERY